jgi:transcriptional regulator with PAS, ATPase and Fis domain
MIVLEATRGVCLALQRDADGDIHFARALSACRTISHKYYERWIGRQQNELQSSTSSSATPRKQVDVTTAALLLTDVTTILGAGHSLDLLFHRAAAVLEPAFPDGRVQVQKESGLEYQSDFLAHWDQAGDGTCRIRVRGSDRRITLQITNVRTLDELSLVKSVADLVRAAVHRTSDAENDDDEQILWPRFLARDTDDAVFQSPRMMEVLKIAVRLAATDLPILLGGETGTGKEVFARLIHEHSRVKRGPFVPYNCSAMPRDLVESQLFGHRRGAFTGATDSFPGLIRSAEHGTLFLDEVGDLDPAIQPKLLRFLEGAEIHPIGELKPQRVPVRIVAATNANLDSLVEEGRFRRDLFYRLGVARVALPPLRERKDEIAALAALFLTRYSRECHRTGVRLGDDLIAALLLYDWPGNIRQLANEIRRVVAMADDGQVLHSGDLVPEITAAWNNRSTTPPSETANRAVIIRLDQPLDRAVDELERTFVNRAMETTGGRVTEAAELLGISRKGLFLKRRRWALVEES